MKAKDKARLIIESCLHQGHLPAAKRFLELLAQHTLSREDQNLLQHLLNRRVRDLEMP